MTMYYIYVYHILLLASLDAMLKHNHSRKSRIDGYLNKGYKSETTCW